MARLINKIITFWSQKYSRIICSTYGCISDFETYKKNGILVCIDCGKSGKHFFDNKFDQDIRAINEAHEKILKDFEEAKTYEQQLYIEEES